MNTFLMPPARHRGWSNAGAPAAGCKLYTYEAGTSTPKDTYQDAAGTIPHENPITLDAKGEALIYWAGAYKVDLRTAAGVTITGYPVDNYTTPDVEFAANELRADLALSSGAGLVNFVQSGSGTLPRTIQEKMRENVSVKDFGAKGDGVTDDRPAFIAAIAYVTAKGGTVSVPDATVSYRLTNTVSIPSNVTLQGIGKPTIKRDFADGFVFLASGAVFACVNNLRIVGEIPSTVSPGGAVGFQSCNYCTCENVEIVGMRQFGVWVYDSSYCIIRGNNMRAWIGAYFQDSADISILNDSNNNLVEGNNCFGTLSDHGISIQDTYAGAKPTGNKIINNVVGEHRAYGILVYVTNNFDTQTLVDGNTVRDIQGSSLFGASGAGIYIQSAGGTIVTNNTVTNCCRASSNFFTLAPACIGVTTPPGTPSWPIIVANNSLDSVRGPGVAVIGTGGPVTVKGNSISLNCADAAANPTSIYVSNAPRISVSGNTIDHVSPSYAIAVVSRSAIVFNGVLINDNDVQASVYGISVNRIDTATFEAVRISGNYVKGCTAQAMIIRNASGVMMTNNILNSPAVVLEVQFSPGTLISNNALYGPAGSSGVIFANGCANSVFSESNVLTTRMENNPGSGVIVSMFGSAPPAVGTWSPGDRVIQSVPAIGSPKGWRYTAALVWSSEGNL